MKIALIGQDVPTLLPALLTDLLFAGNEANAEVTVEESNPAMQELLQGYGEKIFEKAGKGGTILVSADRAEVLTNADCVIYAGDCQAASRFFQDRSHHKRYRTFPIGSCYMYCPEVTLRISQSGKGIFHYPECFRIRHCSTSLSIPLISD